MRENHVKTISLGEGLRYDLSCTPTAFKVMSMFSLGPSDCETKSSFKQFGMGYVSMATAYMILKNGGRPTNSIISRVLLILEH